MPMHVKSPLLVSLLGASALLAPAAHADVVTLGSDLAAPATVVQSSQADTAFWPIAVKGAPATAPAAGQILSVRVKGMAVRPDGAAPPLNDFHIQTLDAEAGDVMKVYLSSSPFSLPYTGDQNQINEFKPDNLCIHQGGALGFNDEGGWD